MYISRLAIKNFRNFGDPAFVIGLRPFTLLLGENNIGKSNLLCAVSLLFGQELSGNGEVATHAVVAVPEPPLKSGGASILVIACVGTVLSHSNGSCRCIVCPTSDGVP